MKNTRDYLEDWINENLPDRHEIEDGDMIQFADDYLEYFLDNLGVHVDFDEFLGLWKPKDIVKEILKREND